MVTGVRHWSTSVYTRVAIDLGGDVEYEASRVPNPDRIFFDLHGAKLSPELIGKAVTVTDGGYLKRIRAAQYSNDVVRIVLDVSDVSEYSAFLLPNPDRLIIDIHGKAGGAPAPVGSTPVLVASAPSASSGESTPAVVRRVVPITRTPPGSAAAQPANPAAGPDGNSSANQGAGTSGNQGVNQNAAPPLTKPGAGRTGPASAEALGEIAKLDRQPTAVKATRQPTTAPVAATVADTTPAPQPGNVLAPAPDLTTRRLARVPGTVVAEATRAHGVTAADTPAPGVHAADRPDRTDRANPAIASADIHAALPTAAGDRSMVRALGLKIGRIVVDAGHGGHDSGTLGPGGIEEKNVVLDVSLRLGRLLKQRLGADVIYTRDDDTFIPLETRTAIANKAQADLFISVHANSSPDASARGVETYYLNFTTSADALETAARENAVSDESIHQLSDLVKKITLQDKIAESREFAGDVEGSLYNGLEAGNPGLKDRGVKKAPFVVLIGANMPSILAEISFLTNPDDAHQLQDPEYRERIAESLYRGVAKYISSLSGVRLAQGGAHQTGE
jgi:N-acetylmuramoyl-L-alanine amidase